MKLKKVTQKIITNTRNQLKPSEFFANVIKGTDFAPVQKPYMEWLDVEKKLEDEYRRLQEASFTLLLKKNRFW